MDFAWARDLSDEAWCGFLAGTLDIPNRTAPALPPDQTQRLFVGCAGSEALIEAQIFLRDVKKTMERNSAPMHDQMHVLDFGAGWGRLYRVLMRDIPPDRLVGADPNPSCVEMCRAAMPFGSFVEIPREPPYPFGDNAFDVIYGFSVFTHLSQATFEAILDEFARILKPAGFLCFTTLRADHIDFWDAHSGDPTYEGALKQAGFDSVEWRNRFERGEFLFLPTGGAAPLETPDIYGWALIGRPCLERSLRTRPFEILVMYEPAGIRQAFVALRKKGGWLRRLAKGLSQAWASN